MKTLNYIVRYSVTYTAFFLSFMTLVNLSAQDANRKVFEEEFNLNKSSSFSLKNKYGDIEIENWANDKIYVSAEIKADASKPSQAQDILKYIDIQTRQEGDEIIVETSIDDKISKSLGNWFSEDKKSFEINYKIKMPSTVPLNVYNKYGSVFINEHTAHAMIEVKYGNLKANRLIPSSKKPMSEIILGYSNADIEECAWIKVQAKYSKVNIEKSKALIMLSKYSKFSIDKGSSLVVESKYDSYDVGSMSNFVGSAGYSNFRFENLAKKLVLETKYTDVIVDEIAADFEEIKIDNAYGSYKLGISEEANYDLQGVAKYAKIHYSGNSKVNRFQEGSEFRVDGIVGNGSGENSVVRIDTKYGNIKLER